MGSDDQKGRKPSQEGNNFPPNSGDQNDNDFKRTSSNVPPLPFNHTDYEGNYEDDDDEEDSNLLEIMIQSLTGTTFQVRVSPWETGGGLKNLLHKSQGIPACHQHLLMGQKELVDNESLIDQGIRDGSTLKLILSLKGGPINSRRLPSHDDSVWREFADYFDLNKEELWDDTPGRQVTLLVLHEGDAVNLYRVVENEDGSFSPLNESWGSNGSGAGKEALLTDRESTADENAKLHERLIDLKSQMEALRITKKARKQRGKKSPVVSPRLTVSRSVKLNKKTRQILSLRQTNSSKAQTIVEPSQRIFRKQRRASTGGLHPPIDTVSSRQTRNNDIQRPLTQSGRVRDRGRFNVSRGAAVLDGIPGSLPPKHVDFSRHPRLDSIKSLRERSYLGPLNENTSMLPLSVERKNYEAYRHSLVRHGKVTHLPTAVEDDQTLEDPIDRLPSRDVSVPLYLNPPKPKIGRNKGRLNKTQNESTLKVLHEFDDRPKTSPEILEHRPGSASTSTTISDIIQLRGPDEKLKEIIGILNSSRANTPLTHRSSESFASQWMPQGQKGLTSSRHSNKGSLSLSVASLRALSPPAVPPTPPGFGNSVRQQPKKKRTVVREVYRSQNGGFQASSRLSTPETSRISVRKANINGNVPTTSNGLPPVKNKVSKRPHPRCMQCRKKLRIGMAFTCRCGLSYCSQHRYAEAHDCSYDYKAQGRKLIHLANPLVEPSKLPKI